MKKNQGLSFSLVGNWLKGIWSSFIRFVRRSLRPNQGRRPISSNSEGAKPTLICPLVGISQFRHAESLTVSELIAKVEWRIPTSQKTAASANSVASVKDEINWD